MIVWFGCARETPLGPVWAAVSERGVAATAIGAERAVFAGKVEALTRATPAWDEAQTAAVIDQITQYLRGQRRVFDLPIDWSFQTPFQQEVLRAVCAIPYSQTISYGALAERVGRPPGAARAVGQANAANPIPLIIPCHRVVGNNGELRGYGGGGGVETKAWLLRLEGSRLI